MRGALAVVVCLALAGEGRGAGAPRVEMVAQFGHTAAITDAQFSADGRLLVTGSADYTLKVWDVATGVLLRTLDSHTEAVSSIAVSADGRVVVSGADDRLVKVWDVETGRVLHTFDAHRVRGFEVLDVQLSRDGRRLLSRDSQGWILWGVPARRELHREARRVDLVMSGDGAWAIESLRDSPGQPKRIVMLEQGTVVREVPDHGDVVALSGDDRFAVSDDWYGKGGGLSTRGFRVWDVATGAEVKTILPDQIDGVFAAVFSADGKVITVVARDQVSRWELSTGKRVFESTTGYGVLDAPGGMPGAQRGYLALSPDGLALVMNPDLPELMRLWDAATGTAVRALNANAAVRAAAFAPDGKHVLIGSASSLSWWDVETLGQLRAARVKQPILGAAVAGARAVTVDGDHLTVWTLPSLSPRVLAPEMHDELRKVALSGPLVFVAGDDWARPDGWDQQTVHVWDLAKNAFVKSYPNVMPIEGGLPWGIAISPDGRWGAVGGNDRAVSFPGAIDPLGVDRRKASGRFSIFDVASGQPVRQLAGHQSEVVAVAFSGDGTRLLSGGLDDTVRIWNSASGALLRTLTGHQGDVTSVAWSPDGRLVLSGSEDKTARLWDAQTGKPTRVLVGHSAYVTQVAFAPDGKHVMTASLDGSTRLWNLGDDASVALISAGDEWLAYTPDGMFDASRGGGGLVAAVRGFQPYRIDQLAVQNNRPDLMLERMHLGSAEIVAHYRARHQRRLAERKLAAVPAGALTDAPAAEIVDVVVTPDAADVTFELAAAKTLAGYQITVNQVPLYGPAGKPGSGARLRVTEHVALAQGKSRIEVSAFDAAGAESLRSYRDVTVAATGPGDLYYVGFGVSRYRDARLNLRYAHKDALDLGELFARAKGAYRAVHVNTFVDDQVTVAALQKARQLVAGAGVNDTVVVFVAGHGTHTRDAAADFYFVTHETEPRRLRETAAPFTMIEALLQGIAPRRKLLLLDTCESGDSDPDLAGLAAAPGATSRIARALVLVDDGDAPVVRRRVVLERERFSYNDLARRTGAIVFSSSRGWEASYEDASIQNGYFTSALKQVLTGGKGGWVGMNDLRQRVGDLVARATGDAQHPTIDRDNPVAGLELPLVSAAALTTPADRVAPGHPAATVQRSPRGCGCRTGGASSGNRALFVALAFALIGWRLSLSCSWGRRRRAPRRGRSSTSGR